VGAFLKGKVPDDIIDEWRLPENWWGYIIYLTPEIKDIWKNMVATNAGLRESNSGAVWGPAIKHFRETIFTTSKAKAVLDALEKIGQIDKVPSEVMVQIQKAMSYKDGIAKLYDRLNAAGKKSDGIRSLFKDLGEFVLKVGIGSAAAYSTLQHLFKLAKVVACGRCFDWGYRYLKDHPRAVLHHGTVREPFSDGPEFPHAWVTQNGIVKDWQTMEAGHGGKYNRRGYPEAVFAELWRPRETAAFTLIEATLASARTGHYGPWEQSDGVEFRQRRSDLTPALGYPGGPCHVVQRIESEIKSPALRTQLIHEVEDGGSLSNPEAAKVYDLEQERGAGIAQRLVIGPHAQYRMDLRGVTVPQIRAAIFTFSKLLNDWKSQRSPQYGYYMKLLAAAQTINFTEPRLGLTIVFKAEGQGTIKIVTTYWQGDPDPEPPLHGCSERVAHRYLMSSVDL
jgi:hypothetical protein